MSIKATIEMAVIAFGVTFAIVTLTLLLAPVH